MRKTQNKYVSGFISVIYMYNFFMCEIMKRDPYFKWCIQLFNKKQEEHRTWSTQCYVTLSVYFLHLMHDSGLLIQYTCICCKLNVYYFPDPFTKPTSFSICPFLFRVESALAVALCFLRRMIKKNGCIRWR